MIKNTKFKSVSDCPQANSYTSSGENKLHVHPVFFEFQFRSWSFIF